MGRLPYAPADRLREMLSVGTVYLWQLFVRPNWQGHGIATQLMQAAGTEAAERGYRGMRLWTPQGARRARRFYEREGWSVTGRTNPNSPFGLPTVEYARGVLPANRGSP